MNRLTIPLVVLIGFFAAFLPAQEPEESFSTHRITVKRKNGVKFTGHFYDHAKYRQKTGLTKEDRAFYSAKALPPVSIPFDYAKSTSFPMLGNDQAGDCFYASACHHDQTFTGSWGTQSQFTLSVVLSRYRTLSGGDNGLYDAQIQGEWKDRYLADVPLAKAVDWLYVDTTNAADLQSAMYYFGGTQFTLTVAQGWINNSDTGDVWDSNTYSNNNNGHAVHFNGVDGSGNYKLQTWGTFVWITPKAVKVCNPDGFVVFSPRWFNAKGYAVNGKHITELAAMWVSAGGKAIPASVISAFPPPGDIPPDPGPGPTPVPGGVSITLSKDLKAGTYYISPGGGSGIYVTPDMTLKQILDAMKSPNLQEPAKKSSRLDAIERRQDELEKNQERLVGVIADMQKMIGAVRHPAPVISSYDALVSRPSMQRAMAIMANSPKPKE